MIAIIEEKLNKEFCEAVIKNYLTRTSYPEGCSVDLKVIDGKIVAEVRPYGNPPSYTTATSGDIMEINYGKIVR